MTDKVDSAIYYFDKDTNKINVIRGPFLILSHCKIFYKLDL